MLNDINKQRLAFEAKDEKKVVQKHNNISGVETISGQLEPQQFSKNDSNSSRAPVSLNNATVRNSKEAAGNILPAIALMKIHQQQSFTVGYLKDNNDQR